FILTTRRYWVDMPQTAMVLICLGALVYSSGFRHRGWSVAFGGAFGLALLVKYTAIWFVGPPALASLVWGMWRERPSRRMRVEFVASGTV
ncbi:hypothetical protein, partial [Pseudomonas sp. FW305-3-2-15-C-LB1]|uniref:hypothetical protein n=1 Tax=Pseudomonas sp. FW305-3-2-15-C-LB1 TaxID=2751331 RepID=UPI000CA7E1AE